MNPGNARPFLVIHSSFFIIHFSLFHCPFFILHYSLFIYIGKVTSSVSANVDIRRLTKTFEDI